MLFSGYVKDPEKTEESMLPDNWWKTGDLAVLQENGTYKIAGRSKDMIIRGGENIQPTEIENYYNEFEAIDDVYVIGVPSKRLGEEVAAYIKVSSDLQPWSHIAFHSQPTIIILFICIAWKNNIAIIYNSMWQLAVDKLTHQKLINQYYISQIKKCLFTVIYGMRLDHFKI